MCGSSCVWRCSKLTPSSFSYLTFLLSSESLGVKTSVNFTLSFYMFSRYYKQDDVNDLSLRRAVINYFCCKFSQRVIIQLWEKISTREKNDLHGVA